jgi:hypothetical protein
MLVKVFPDFVHLLMLARIQDKRLHYYPLNDTLRNFQSKADWYKSQNTINKYMLEERIWNLSDLSFNLSVFMMFVPEDS